MNKWITDNLWRHVVGVLVAFFALFPLYLVIISSINPTGSLQVSSFIPTEFSLRNYQQLFNDPTIPYLVWMKNTLLISGAVAILSVIIGALSAVYVIMERVYNFAPGYGLGTQPGLLLVYLGGAMGVNIWLLKGFVDSIPIELDEAAKVDGASAMQTYWQIFIPLAAPILAVVSLLSFIGTFNEFILARLFLVDMNSRTIAVGLQGFIGGQYSQNWGAFAAGSIIASIPIVIIFLSLQKYIISGLTAGSVKG